MPKKIYSFIFLVFTSCISSGPKYETPQDFVEPVTALDLKNIRSLYFSADGNQALYIQNFTNKSPQIMHWNLLKNERRQITHQVGEIYDVAFMPGEKKIIYTSSTDEDKENPVLLRTYFKPDSIDIDTRNTEIYISDISGANIKRITKHSGFDGYFDVHPLKEDIIYTEKSYKYYRIRKGKNQSFPVYISASSDESFPVFSPNGNHLVWLSKKEELITLKVRDKYPNKKTKTIPLKGFTQVSKLSFHPQSEWLLISGIREAGDQNIFALDISSECILQLTYSPGLDTSAIFHPDGQKWYFISDRLGGSDLWQSTYFPTSACENNGEEEKK